MTELEEEIRRTCAMAAAADGENNPEVDVRIAAICDSLATDREAGLHAIRLALVHENRLVVTERLLARLSSRLDDGPAGSLLGAEILYRKGDLPGYLAALGELAAKRVTDRPELTPFAALVLTRGREHAMQEWGRGRLEETIEMLDALGRICPDDLDVVAERLFVLVMNRMDDPRTRLMVDRLSKPAWRHRRIALLASFFHTRKSGFADCLAAAGRWAAADTGSIEGIERLARHVSLTIAFRQLLGPDGAGPDGAGAPGWIADSAALRAIAAEMFSLARDLREFQDQIFHLVLANQLQLPDALGFFSTVLEELAESDIPADWLGQILALFLAHDDKPRAARIAALARRDDAVPASPHLAKFACLYAQLAGDRDMETALLGKVLHEQPDPQNWHGLPRLQVRELRARAGAVAMERFAVAEWPELLAMRDRLIRDFPMPVLPSLRSGRSGGPPRIALALFGQLRDPDVTLPQVKDYLLGDIAAHDFPTGSEFRFVIATWNRQARKQLEPGYPLGEFTGLLPPDIGRLANGLGLRTSGDFAHAFPGLFDELLRRSAQAQAEIGAEWAAMARGLFGDATLIEIGDEAEVERDIEGFCEVDPSLRGNSALRNQFKMYHRIAGIGRLVEEWESEADAAIDLVVLTRPDMLYETGSVMRHAQRLLAAGTANTIICDWNAGAMMNEGLGDNIVIGTRRAMATLFAGYSRLSATFGPDAGALADYRLRIWGHRFLGSSVFTDGIDLGLVPPGEVRWQLHRGRLDLAALRPALAKDAEFSPRAEVRKSLAALLAA